MKNNINKKIGATLLTAAVMTGTFVIPVAKATDAEIKAKPSVSYQAHVENIGWQDAINSGIAGTTGQALRMEAIRMKLENCENASLSFDVHIQDIGWRYNLTEEDIIGTTGQCLKMEAVTIKSKGLAEKGYKIQYRVHGENYGWTNWVEEGTVAGTTGQFLRLEAIEVRVVTDSTAIEAAKEKAVVELTNYVENSSLKNIVPGSETDYASVPAINEVITAGYNAIAEATTIEGVANAEKEAETAIVEATKEYAQHLLNTIYNNGEEYFGLILTNTKYEFYKEQLNNAETVKDIVETYEYVVNAERINLSDLQEKASADLTNYVENSALKNTVPGSEMDYASVPAINEVIVAGYTAIAEAKTAEGPANAEKEAETAIVEATKEYAQHLLDTIYNNGEEYFGLVLSEAKYNAYTAGIAEATNVEDAINAYEAATRERVELAKLQEEAVAELTNYVENSSLKNIVPGSEMDYASVPTINETIIAGYTAVADAKKEDDVATAVEATKTAVVEATREYTQHLLDTIYNNGEEYFGLILTNTKYEFYKEQLNNAETVKDLVETYEYVVNAERFTLTDLKANAVKELDEYKNAEDYAEYNAETLANAIEAGKTAIEACENKEAIDTAVAEAKAAIDEIKTDKEIIAEIEDAQKEASEALTNYVENNEALKSIVPGSESDYLTLTEINKAVAEGYSKLYSEDNKSAEAVVNAEKEAETAILNATKEATKRLVNSIYNNGEGYSIEGSDIKYFLLSTDRDIAIKAIDEATTEAEAIEAFENVIEKELISEDKFNIEMAKIVAIEKVNEMADAVRTAAKNEDGTEKYKVSEEKIAEVIENATNAINACEGEDVNKNINAEVNKAMTALNKIKEDDEAFYNLQKDSVAKLLDIYTCEESSLNKLVPGSELKYIETPDIQSALQEGISNIWNATTSEEVDKAEKDAEASVINATKEYVKYLLGVVYENGVETTVYENNVEVGKVQLYLPKTKYDFFLGQIKNAESCKDAISEYEYVLNRNLAPEEQSLKTLEELKAYYEEKITDDYVSTAYTYTNNEAEFNKAIADSKEVINAATDLKSIEKAYEEAKATMENVATDSDINSAYNELNTKYYTALRNTNVQSEDVELTSKKYINVKEIYNEIRVNKGNIEASKTKTELENSLEEAERVTVKATRTYVKELLNSIRGFNNDKYLAETDYGTALNLIETKNDIQVIINAYHDAYNARKDVSATPDTETEVTPGA